MGIRFDRTLRQWLIFASIILMLLGLFCSRALLSIAFILFLVPTCIHANFLQQAKAFFNSPFLFAMALLFLVPFVSWFWSHDQFMWARFARIKLPLLLFPLAFAGTWQLSRKHWRWAAWWFMFLVFAGCVWSVWQYVQSPGTIHAAYLRAKIFDTPLDNDHVRFSLLVCMAVLCAVYLFVQHQQRTVRVILVAATVFFVIYLHLLSARTGLYALYFLLVAVSVYFLLAARNTKLVLLTTSALLLLPVAAWFLLPTFQNRLRYNVYDLSNVLEHRFLAGSNDGNRILSYKAAWVVLKEHPLGVGSDVVNKAFDWYGQNFPQMRDEDKLFPASEPLMYAGFAGWPGMILFLLAVVMPFFELKKRGGFFWFGLNSIMALSLLFDIGLEAQFGVFIYAFFLLWWWKWIAAECTSVAAVQPERPFKIPCIA